MLEHTVNLVVIPQCYMLPSDLELHVVKINGWNNNTLIADFPNARLGEIRNINNKSKVEESKFSKIRKKKW